MTQKEIEIFIKDKIVPLFDGMNAKDIVAILDLCMWKKESIVLSQFTLSLNRT